MQIVPIKPDHLAEAAALFVEHFKTLRRSVPALPEVFEDPRKVVEKLSQMTSHHPGYSAVEKGRLVGYLGGYILKDLRGMGRKSVYCPEWGHGAEPDRKAEVYRALYHAASQEWTASGVRTHALSVLAYDNEARDAWFWNGFGLLVVDAVRPLEPVSANPAPGVTIRLAGMEDNEVIIQLENEHRAYYSQPPVLMRSSIPEEPAALRQLIGQADTIWLGEWHGSPAGILRLETSSEGAADIVQAPGTAAITGLYVRPQARGVGLALAMLQAALAHYRNLGFERCSVDFESFNPTAVAFWMKYFKPVCFSLVRHPEALL